GPAPPPRPAAPAGAAEAAAPPAVSIWGGEPPLSPELRELVEGIISRRRHIYLCTNALLLDTKVFGVVPPHNRLTINVHLDGTKGTHDFICDRDGVFDKAIAMIKEGKARGYRVITNTTVFRETDVDEIERLLEFLSGLGIDGMLISPGYQYATVERDIFLTRQDTHDKFKRILEISKRFRLQSTPMFLEFAAGLR